jgi:integrase
VKKIISKSSGASFCASSEVGQNKTQRAFVPVFDKFGCPIRGLWKRGSKFYARLNLREPDGESKQRRVPLSGESVVQALAELERLKLERLSPDTVKRKTSPIFSDYWPQYLAEVTGTKRAITLSSERVFCRHWATVIGGRRLHLINKSNILQYRSQKLRSGWSGRTANLAITILNNVLAHAQDNGLIDTLPTTDLKPIRWKPKKRPLFTRDQIEAICIAAIKNTRNGQLLADYVRLMVRCGSRATETLRLKWLDVDWGQQQLTIGSDGLSKNHESRAVDFNTALAELLGEMRSRSNGSVYLFPAPRMFGEDAPARSLKEALRKARKLAAVDGFGYHDCRHYFISHAVMSGIDYMTIARWVGHKDGGVLIGRVYGHLNDEHAKRQAKRLRLA